MKKHFLLLTILIQATLQAQNITGTLKHHALQEITLEGFAYYNTLELGKTQADSLGNFSLNYPKAYNGMGVLNTSDNSSLVLMLGQDNINIQGSHITETDSLLLNKSQNKTFFDYAISQGYRRNALNAWKYLNKIYNQNKLFAKQKEAIITIKKELQCLKNQEKRLVSALPEESYFRWFIPYRTFIQDMPIIIRTETERIPESITLFRTTDFNHPHWKTSGIFQEFIEKHYFMLENSSGSLEERQEKMNSSSQYLIDNLQENELLLNTVSSELFNYLEKRSLFNASEYLAITLLNNTQCNLEEDLASKLEIYRKLKVGATAPDVIFKDQQKLSDLKTNKLVVFGASWCPSCQSEALQLLQEYKAWKAKNIETVYISIDTDPTAFEAAYANAPWQVHCDFKGWDTPAAKAYHITGTPSYFLLDENNQILARPNSVAHAKKLIAYYSL